MKITYEVRLRIKEMLDNGIPVTEIAKAIGVHFDSVYAEINRCGGKSCYDPDEAQSLSDAARKERGEQAARRRTGQQIFLEDRELAEHVSRLILEDGLNVQQVSMALEKEQGRFRSVPRSRNTIWNAIDGGLIPGVTREVFNRKIVSLSSSNAIVLPSWLIKRLALSEGDEFSVEVRGDAIVLSKLKR